MVKPDSRLPGRSDAYGQLVAANTHLVDGLVERLLRKIGTRGGRSLHPEDPTPPSGGTRIIGFSNYSWTCNLGQEYARRIKERFPEVVVVFGGPNYGTSVEEHLDFWTRYPYVDFYVMKEGENATVALVEALERHGLDAEALKRSGERVPSCHFMLDGELIEPPLLPRIKDLTDLPSPYLAGMMDKFFDDVLIPMTYTTRGCPFKCTFCTEGTDYYNRVAKRATLEEDLDYIGQRRDHPGFDHYGRELQEDRGKAMALAKAQSRAWPGHIHVSAERIEGAIARCGVHHQRRDECGRVPAIHR